MEVRNYEVTAVVPVQLLVTTLGKGRLVGKGRCQLKC